jgi:ubiquinone/menaquinone biosynthesis C-methylase UbiE
MTEGSVPRPGNYDLQAETFDRTRGASPTVLAAIDRVLGHGGARRLLDVGGGTGNYAQALAERDFDVLVLDANLAMLGRAVPKLGRGRCVQAAAEALPFADGCADVVAMVNAAHLFQDRARAFAEALRVLRGGPLLVTAFTQENAAPLFVFGYFGMEADLEARPDNGTVERWLHEAGFGTVERSTYVYADTVDGSLNALHTDAAKLADPEVLRNTSLWHRTSAEARERAVQALRRDLDSGELERRVAESVALAEETGHGTLFAAWA